MQNSLQNRIALTRYLMVIGIVVLHTPPYQPLSELGLSVFDLIKAFFSHALFRMTVPVLTVISAYLLFSSKLVTQPGLLLKKKTQAILIPLILWNLPVVLAIYLVQKYGLLNHNFSTQLVPFNLASWADAFTGIFEAPANYPLNFLRDLFVLAVISPLFLLILRLSAYGGILLVGAIYYFNLDGDLILRNSMLISFYTGALLAWKKWDLEYFDKFAWPMLAILITVCLAVIIWDIENREWLRIIAPFIVWPCMALICNTRFGVWLVQYSQCSFLTFLAHAPLLLVFWVLYQKLGSSLPYALFWFTAPLVITALCAWVHPYLYKLMPNAAKLALGGR